MARTLRKDEADEGRHHRSASYYSYNDFAVSSTAEKRTSTLEWRKIEAAQRKEKKVRNSKRKKAARESSTTHHRHLDCRETIAAISSMNENDTPKSFFSTS